MNYVYLTLKPLWQKYHLSRYRKIVELANKLADDYSPLSDEELDRRRTELHSRAQGKGKLDEFIAPALALGRELSWRRLKMRHYDVQLIGTLALYEGHIAEMDTGEGKTLMAPLAAFLHHLGRLDRCVHIVTANEYLAERDAKWMAPLYEALGLSVGLIVPGQGTAERVKAYQQDVVYATAKEVVFDSLREPIRKKRMSQAEAILRPEAQLQLDPKYDFSIVDEVDSVLIDQARSPLSVGGVSEASPQVELYRQADAVAGQLTRGAHYRLMQDDQKIELKDEGKAQAKRQAGDIWRLLPPGHSWERYVVCALAARHIYKRDEHYVARNNTIVLVDESTGRLMPGRQLPDGIHQAIEIRNGIIPSTELRGNYQTTFQTFFRMYGKLAGMTGTASMSAWEFSAVYDLAVVPIPSNKPSHRHLLPDSVYRSTKAKYQALIDDIARVHQTGRPLLIGTGSVRTSETISQMLSARGLEHEVLNAKNHAREASIIAEAGQEGRITIITNMAGRGVDILLGPEVADKGGMFLMGTDRAHYRRLDSQLSGRIGRQGDPGDCRFFLSLKDDLIRYAKRKRVCRLRMKTRNNRYGPIESDAGIELFAKVQHHIDKFTRKHRHLLFQEEKRKEKLKEQGIWEDWMDVR